MAIYHLSMQIISRSKGQSAVASASYRSGEKLVDERTGETKFYVRDVQPETMILAPSNSPDWVQDRNCLWNEVEKIEKRKDSQLAREMNIALPKELSNEQQKELISNFVQSEFVDKGMIADVAIHRDDKENPHAHVMLTMRTIDEKGFGKKNRDWNAEFANSKTNQRGFVKSGDSCLSVREQWAVYANEALEKAQINERITHLSHEARGLEQLPTIHEGFVARQMEEREAGSSDLVKINNEIKEYNKNIIDLSDYRKQKEELEKEQAKFVDPALEKRAKPIILTEEEKFHIVEASRILKKKNPSYDDILNRLEQLKNSEKRINNGTQERENRERKLNEAKHKYEKINDLNSEITVKKFKIEQLPKITFAKFNPFDKRETPKDRLEKQISELKLSIVAYEGDIHKLGFTNEEAFKKEFDSFRKEKFNLISQEQGERKVLLEERGILEKAKLASENGHIRTCISKYPDNPEMAYLDKETARSICNFNHKFKETVSLEFIKEKVDEGNKYKEILTKGLKEVNNEEQRRSIQDQLSKFENSEGLNMFGGILQGIQQASVAMTMDRNRQDSTPNYKGKKKRHEHDLELG